MKIALTHYYNKGEHVLLEKENISLEEAIRSIAKILTIESEIDESSSMATKRVAKLLVENYNFYSNLKEYTGKKIDELGITEKVNFRNIIERKDKERIYILDAYGLWEEYLCRNYKSLDNEIEKNSDNLTGLLYKEVHKAVIEDRTSFYNWCLSNLEKNYKKVIK